MRIDRLFAGSPRDVLFATPHDRGGEMTLNTYIHQQLAAVHKRDLLEAADRARLAAQARHNAAPRRRPSPDHPDYLHELEHPTGHPREARDVSGFVGLPRVVRWFENLVREGLR